jgi:hypothetical protein
VAPSACGRRRWRRPWVAVLVVGTAANALYFVVPVPWTSPWYVATGALCAAVMAARAPSLGSERRTWTILTAGQAVTVLGDALFLFGPQPTGPPVATGVLYLGAYALAGYGIVLLLVRPTVVSYPAALTDAGIATVVTVLLLVGPVARTPALSASRGWPAREAPAPSGRRRDIAFDGRLSAGHE